ncbi:hypothetical protein ABFA25_03305 [Mycobacterium lepromatosis]
MKADFGDMGIPQAGLSIACSIADQLTMTGLGLLDPSWCARMLEALLCQR